MTQSLPHRMPGLDGLRGVASAVVLIGHAVGMMLDTSFVTRGYLGVQFFWMLSGFVIAHAYQVRLSTGMTVSDYLWRRIVRLYPLIAASAVLGALVLLATNQHFSLTDPHALLASLGAILCVPVPAAAFAHGNSRSSRRSGHCSMK